MSEALVEELVGDLSSIRAPRGAGLHAGSWQTEAPLRMLLNNLDAEVAEHPESLVVYGGTGRAARSHDALRAIVSSTRASTVRRRLLTAELESSVCFSCAPGSAREYGVKNGRRRGATA